MVFLLMFPVSHAVSRLLWYAAFVVLSAILLSIKSTLPSAGFLIGPLEAVLNALLTDF